MTTLVSNKRSHDVLATSVVPSKRTKMTAPTMGAMQTLVKRIGTGVFATLQGGFTEAKYRDAMRHALADAFRHTGVPVRISTEYTIVIKCFDRDIGGGKQADTVLEWLSDAGVSEANTGNPSGRGGSEQTLILEYKTTAKVEPHHAQQVSAYQRLYAAMYPKRTLGWMVMTFPKKDCVSPQNKDFDPKVFEVKTFASPPQQMSVPQSLKHVDFGSLPRITLTATDIHTLVLDGVRCLHRVLGLGLTSKAYAQALILYLEQRLLRDHDDAVFISENYTLNVLYKQRAVGSVNFDILIEYHNATTQATEGYGVSIMSATVTTADSKVKGRGLVRTYQVNFPKRIFTCALVNFLTKPKKKADVEVFMYDTFGKLGNVDIL